MENNKEKSQHEKNMEIISRELNVAKSELILFSAITKAGKQEIFNKLINVIDIN